MLNLRVGVTAPVYQLEACDLVRDDHEAWQSDGPIAMEREVQELLYGLVRALKPTLVVEVGSYKGSTTEVLGNALEDNGWGEMVSIEIDPEPAEEARVRCSHLPRVTMVTGDAIEYARGGFAGSINFLVVDGGEDRDVQHEVFAPLLAPEAMVIRHDVLAFQHIREDELEGFDTIILRTPRGVSLSQKK